MGNWNSDDSEETILERLQASTKSLYINTGDRTPSGCIWPMLLEKAWAVYVCKEFHGVGAGLESYTNIDAENNLGAKTTVGDVCLAVAGWNGESKEEMQLLSLPAAASNMIHRMASALDDNTDDGFIDADVRIARQDLAGHRLFLTYIRMWIKEACPTKQKRYHPMNSPNEKQGLTPKEVDELFEHICSGQPAALLTTAKDCDELKKAGLHAAHSYVA